MEHFQGGASSFSTPTPSISSLRDIPSFKKLFTFFTRSRPICDPLLVHHRALVTSSDFPSEQARSKYTPLDTPAVVFAREHYSNKFFCLVTQNISH
ncbi:hypothetical protein CDAR_261301 [Caerostris darwini]|uniref:Uncharacterized protein n=1 Tax=Caerostris darwini TaxID=1538125 RepID=A0AAV4SXN0_9ARAC|nr:hypothetical protein CDAR_261301 [Caerostris darwini]